ncbi:transcriptional regulator BetI [Kaistia adipata]|uniref:transcriptional regulator BetI n=1 Tax=Kaistia adipata TaxID=166954 RepID=UPI00040C725F|nr:transcriptional regulator BetI [Kaistia adipata]
MAGTGSVRGDGEDARRLQLIEATIESLADVGFAACTLMDIGRRAGVSPGLVAHYFGDKEGLLEATLRHMAGRISRLVSQRLVEAHSPRARVQAVIDANLAPEEFDRRTASVWLAFWGQVIHSARFRRVQNVYQKRMLSNLRHALRQMVPARDAEHLAVTIASIIDGLWLRATLVAEGEQEGSGARAIATALVDAELAVIRARAPEDGRARPDGGDKVSGQHIAGRAVLGGGRVRIRANNPATGEVLAEIELATPDDLEAAIAAARRGQAAWAALDGAERGRVLRRVADQLRAQDQAIAHLEAAETGRPIRYTLADVAIAADCFARCAALAEVPRADDALELGLGRLGTIRREPAGIVAMLGAGSRPLYAAALRAAPALAAGNALILQSSGDAPLVLARLAAILEGAGLPAGAVNHLHGAEELGRALAEHPGIDQMAAGCNGEGGATLVVFDGADPDIAVAMTLEVAFRAGAARFGGPCRVLVQQGAKAAFVERLLAATGRLVTGDPLDARTEHGAMGAAQHPEVALAAVDAALAGGARLLAGGSRVAALPSGAFLAPTILEQDAGGTAWFEADCPGVVLLAGFADEAEALRRVDLAAGAGTVFLFTPDLGRAERLSRHLRAAACWINFRDLPADAAAGADLLSFDRYTRRKRVAIEFSGNGAG